MLNRNAIVIIVCLAGCTGGTFTPTGEPAETDPDADPAAPDADPLAPDGPASPSDPDAGAVAADCAEAVANPGNGEHNPGQPCLLCHTPGGDGPPFTIGGTVYTDAAGGTPVVGGTIRVVDANGLTLDLVTRTNGNFWSTQDVAFPIEVLATRCPDTAPMISASPSGDCNAGGCHSAGAASGRVHLP